MYLIVSYDVDCSNCQKYMKILRKYLFHVHNSVFEGELTEGEYLKMTKELSKIIDDETDSIIIYKNASIKALQKKYIGIKRDFETLI